MKEMLIENMEAVVGWHKNPVKPKERPDLDLPIGMIQQSSSEAQSRVGPAPPQGWEWKSTVGWALKPPSISEPAFYQRHSKSQSSVHNVCPPKLHQLGATEGKFVIKTQENNQNNQKTPP